VIAAGEKIPITLFFASTVAVGWSALFSNINARPRLICRFCIVDPGVPR